MPALLRDDVRRMRSHPAGPLLAGTISVLAVMILLTTETAVSAQAAQASAAPESRAAAIAAEQSEKATRLRPYEPSAPERIIVEMQQRLLEQPSGFYPMFGSVYGGGGFTLGGGYRRFFGDRAFWDAHGLYSIRNYKLLETGIASPGHARGRLDLGARVGWRDATQVGFYGEGMDTSVDERANYRFQQSYVAGGALFRPVFPIVLGLGVAYEDFNVREGQGSFPSIEQLYPTAPGLGLDPAYVHTEATGAIDWRTSRGYSRTGGYYGVTWHEFTGVDHTDSFERLDVTLVQHIPILRETWVISLRGEMQTTVGDGLVPFVLLPALGSGSTLRGYSSWRFRDRHSLLTSAEWRWIPNRLGLDMALFYDAGKVTNRRGDLDFNGLVHDWGIGVRFHGPSATPLRVELARGSEGWHLVFAGSAAF